MGSIEAEDRITQDDHRPAFDCDLSAQDGRDEVCIREYLRAHIPVLV